MWFWSYLYGEGCIGPVIEYLQLVPGSAHSGLVDHPHLPSIFVGLTLEAPIVTHHSSCTLDMPLNTVGNML